MSPVTIEQRAIDGLAGQVSLSDLSRCPDASSVENNRQLPRAAGLSMRPDDFRAICQSESGYRPQPFLKCHKDFHTSQVRSDATMYAQPERGMPILLPINHDLVRIGKRGGISIGSRKTQHHRLALLQFPTAHVACLDNLACHGHWRVR